MTGYEHKTLKLASDLHRFLLERSQLKLLVHSVFETSINLMADEELLTMAAGSRELMPMGFIVDTAELDHWGLEAEDVVIYDQNAFQLPQGIRISLEGAEIREVSLSESLESDSSIDRASLQIIRSKLLESEAGGISDLAALLPESDVMDKPLNVYSKYIKEDLFAFLDALRKSDYVAAADLTGRLLGFGPGLTPSGDDFLTGIILFFYYKKPDIDFFQKIVTLARQRTTVLSYHMINNAASGKAYESYLALIRTLGGQGRESLETLADRVLRYGASSGSDFLFGVYCAALILYENENKNVSNIEVHSRNLISEIS